MKPPKEKHQCSKTVWGSTGFVKYPCSINASVFRDEKWWCKRHDPKAVEEKRKRERERYEKKEREEEQLKKKGENLLERLNVKGELYFRWREGYYTDSLVIPFKEIEKILERLETKEAMIHRECGTLSTRGEYNDGTVDYYCKDCDVTFLDDAEQTIIS